MSPIVTLGNVCIVLTIGLSVFGAISFLIARKAESEMAGALGRGTLYASFILMTVANLAMIYALLSDDFAVSYVAHVGSRETPRWVSAISLWSSLEGSILFWGWILSGYSAVCTYVYRENKEKMMPWVGLTLLVVQFFFALLLALPANPFQPVNPVPPNGPGPNPLLQNHWLMAVHPPFLYMGYIGFTIPFAFAVACMLETDLPVEWLTRIRRWILFSWSFLSAAIMLGGWWSYAVLGWGGYWAWDPVENASFMPWLAGTALVHSIIVQEKRNMLPVWNVLLTVVTFLLTLLGTFLTRSGVLESVHSFTESDIGPYFLVFMVFILASSLALMIWRAPEIRKTKQLGRIESVFSLETLFLFNNLLFISFCFVVFLGTLYPLVVEALQGKRISIGEPYFDQMTIPIAGMILLLMSMGLITPWKKANPAAVIKSAAVPFLLGALVTVLTAVLGGRSPGVLCVVLLSSVATFIMAADFLKAASRRRSDWWRLFVEKPRRYCGFIAHIGALMIFVGIAFSKTYEVEHELTMKKGETAQFQEYALAFREIEAEDTPQRYEVRALIDVYNKAGKKISHLTPQMNFYPMSQQPIGSPAVYSTLVDDLYLTLVQFEKDGSSVSIRAIDTPAVVWIWIGGTIVMVGGLLALSLGRRKQEAA